MKPLRQVKLLHAVLTAALALLVLLSGTSFMIGVHHCGDRIESIALFSKADQCPKEQTLPPCHKAAKSCCSDERIVHESQDIKPSAANFHLSPAPVIAELVSPVVIASLIPKASMFHILSPDFSPPLPVPDINVAIGKFQI